VEYTFADGTKLFLGGRTMAGCYTDFASYAHGTKGSAIISTAGHHPSKAKLFSSTDFNDDKIIWKAPRKENNPYDLEWDHFLDAIVNNKPYNEVKRGAEASLVTAMGRHAAHTGQEITFDQMLNHEHEFAPNVDKLTLDGPAPLAKLANGKYPVPQPGIIKNREYDNL
jgi:predicted dehydrogenase